MVDRARIRLTPFLLLGLLLLFGRAVAAPAPPLAPVLTSNGRLLPTAHGSFDARGWRLEAGSDGAPCFMPVQDVDAENAGWDNRFSAAGALVGGMYAVAVDGQEIFVGGNFDRLGNIVFNGIARWDGLRWHHLADGVEGQVLSLLLVGDKLYVGGQFPTASGVESPNFAVWNRSTSSWQAVGRGVTGGDDACVSSIIARGSDLYISGKFNAASNTIANNVARYDGRRFWRLGAGTYGPTYAIAFNGDYLYAGGFFQSAGNVPARNVARFNLITGGWEAVGSGTDSTVYAIAGSGNDIYIGGRFDEAGGIRANNIVRWNEASRTWHQVAEGFTVPFPQPIVYSIVVDGDNVYLGGSFRMGFVLDVTWIDSVRCFVRYHRPTNTFHRIGNSLICGDKLFANVNAIVRNGRELYIGGEYPLANSMVANGLSMHHMDATTWRVFGGGVSGTVLAAALWNGSYVVGGAFNSAGGTQVANIATWRDGRWTSLDSGLAPPDALHYCEVRALLPDGDRLIAGGNFDLAGGKPIRGIASWNGSEWEPLGGGVTDPGNSRIDALARLGADIYAGGAFTSIDSQSIGGIARWDGQWWSPLGSGVETTFSDGSRKPGWVTFLFADGDRLYVGGHFDVAGGIPVPGFAVWDAGEQRWSASPIASTGQIRSLIRHRGKLVLSGNFRLADGSSARVIEYDSIMDAWRPLVTAFERNDVAGILASDGRYLYLGGTFTRIDALDVNYLAKWDGVEWSSVGTGPDKQVELVTADTVGVFVTGPFTQTGPVDAYRMGHWTPAPLAAVPMQRDEIMAGSLLGTIRPNPATNAATIPFMLSRATEVSIDIFSPTGLEVASLAGGRFEAGFHSVVWRPEGASAGLYLCRIIAGGRPETRPILLVR